MIEGGELLLSSFLGQNIDSSTRIDLSIIIQEASIGLLMCLCICLPFYMARILSHWLTSSMFVSSNILEEVSDRNGQQLCDVLVLFVAAVFFVGPGFFLAWELFLKSFFVFPLTQQTFQGDSVLLARLFSSLVGQAGSLVLKFALFMFLPFVFIYLLVDLLFVFYIRFLRKSFSFQTYHACRVVLFSLILLTLLYPMQTQVAGFIESVLSADWLETAKLN